MNNKLLLALEGRNQGRPPIWLMRQAGRYMPSYQAFRQKYSFKSLCYEPELITKVTHLPVDELGVDAAIVFSDILLLLESYGCKVQYEEGIGPLIEASHFAIETPQEKINEDFRFLQKAIEELTSSLKVPLIGFAGAPFTLASYLIEGKSSKTLSKTKLTAWEDPLKFKKLINKLFEGIASLLLLQIKAGCQVVQLFDTWADQLPEEDFATWCLDPLRELVKILQPTGTPLIYFCKNSSYRARHIADTGVNAISVDSLQPIERIRKALPHRVLQGNLPPEALLLNQTMLGPLIDKYLLPMRDDPAYIFNLGHGVLPDTPYENVRFLVDKVSNS